MKPEDTGADTQQICDNGISVDLFLHCSLVPACLIVAVLSFLQKRLSRTAIDNALPALSGHFGIVVPLDLVGGLSNRWSYGFAFGAVSSSVMLLFSEFYVPFYVPAWARAFVYLVGALEVGLAYFPFFACLSTPLRAVGAILGIFYTVPWITVTLWDTITCPGGNVLGRFQKPIFQWPCILCLVFLLGRFLNMLLKAIQIYRGLESEEGPEQLMQAHLSKYVQRLLCNTTKQHSRHLDQGKLEKSWFRRKVYDWDPYFKFPNRMIGTSIISLIGLYMITLADYSLSDHAFNQLDSLRDALKDLAISCNCTGDRFTAWVPRMEEFGHVARGAWIATIVFSSLTSVSYIFHVLACYRKHMRRLWAGQRAFLPEKYRDPSSAVSVAAIARYTGWQIAFTLWGYLIVHFVQFLFALVIIYGLVLPIKHGGGLALLVNTAIILVTISLVAALVKLQITLVQIFFLQDRISPTDTQKPLALNNRKAFHNFNYFFFFYNVIMGLTNCLMRLVLSIVVGSWLVSRIDRTIMQRGYESLDPGYSTWIGMIFADHYHSNPVMICFCHILLATKLENRRRTGSLCPEAVPAVSGRARGRWLLFYTLMKNPLLIPLRKRPASPAQDKLYRVALASLLTLQAGTVRGDRRDQVAGQTPD